MYIGVNLLRT